MVSLQSAAPAHVTLAVDVAGRSVPLRLARHRQVLDPPHSVELELDDVEPGRGERATAQADAFFAEHREPAREEVADRRQRRPTPPGAGERCRARWAAMSLRRWGNASVVRTSWYCDAQLVSPGEMRAHELDDDVRRRTASKSVIAVT